MNGSEHQRGPERPARLTAKQQALLALRLQAEMQKSQAAQYNQPAAASWPVNEPIAIIGMGCRLPGGADSPAAFWDLLSNGVDAIQEVPPERWSLADYYDPDPAAPGKMYSRWGAFLPEVDTFDARFFGISPREAANMDPQQRLLLEVTWEALEHAGVVPAALHKTDTGIFIGISTADYSHLGDHEAQGRLRRIDAYYGTGNSFSVAAGRLAFWLGTQGPAFAVDTACSSSLVALHLACQSLRSRECQLAIVGGVNLVLIPETSVFFCKLQAMSPDGRCKAFDASADGYVRGEGAGSLILKRLSAAVRDKDQILAIVRGSAINHDGPSSGLTVPNGPAQQAVIRQALRDAHVAAQDIGYIEAHGTGTSLGDPIEMHALGEVFGPGRPAGQPLYVGSVKSNFGHLEAAAGIAGLMKVVLALQHRQLPPHLHFRQPTPRIEWERLPVAVPVRLTDWTAGGPRLAGVSSFGFSGTNAHVILEEAPVEGAAESVDEGAYLLPISAHSAAALREMAVRYQAFLAGISTPAGSAAAGPRLADICFTAGQRRSHHSHRLAVVGSSAAELSDALGAYLRGETAHGLIARTAEPSGLPVQGPGGRIGLVFVFPGQGPEWLGMGQQLFALGHSNPAYTPFRQAIEQCQAIVQAEAGWSLLDYFSPVPAGQSDVPFPSIEVTHPLLFAIQYGLANLWQAWGVRPAAVVGQSLGEITALCVASALTVEQAMSLMIRRSRRINELRGQGRMAVVGLPAAQCQVAIEASGETLYVAVQRSPDSVVIAGEPETVDRFLARQQAEGVFCRVVVQDVATHCLLAEPIAAALADDLQDYLRPGRPRLPFYSTVTARLATDLLPDSGYWRENMARPVNWQATVETLLDDGYSHFLEIGPHPALLATIEQIGQAGQPGGPGQRLVTIPSLLRQKDEQKALLDAVGQLYTAGYLPDWAAFGPSGGLTTLPLYAWEKERHWVIDQVAQVAGGSARYSQGPAAVKRGTGQAISGAARLRGTPVSSPLAARQYATTFEVNPEGALPPYLTGHQVDETVVVAGAAHVVMALSAAAQLLDGAPARLSNLSFLQPMVVEPGQPLAVQVIIEPAQPTGQPFQIFSQAAGDPAGQPWQEHVSGLMTHPSDPVGSNGHWLALGDSVAGLSVLPLADYYRALDSHSYQLGPAFRWLEAAWLSSNAPAESTGESLIGRFRLPQTADEADDYPLHPGLVDSCFQAIGALHFFAGDRQATQLGQDIFVPLAIGRFSFYRPAGDQLWCQAWLDRKPGQNTAEEQLVSGGLRLLDDAGHLVAEIQGFQAKRVDAARFVGASPGRIKQWLYTTEWRPQPLGSSNQQVAGRWLVAGDGPENAGQVEELTAALKERGGSPVALSSADLPGQIAEQFRTDPAIQGIAYLAGGWHEPGPAAAEEDVLQALALVQAVAVESQATGRRTRLWIITRQAQTIPGELQSEFDQGAGESNYGRLPAGLGQNLLWGLGRVAANELPDLRCTLLDRDGRLAADRLANELLAGGDENQIAYRGEDRYVLRLVHAIPGSELPSGPAAVIRPEATYLVTGGWGGLGLATARWLAGNGARYLLLTGRRSPDGAAAAALDQLRADGVDVSALVVDVADLAALTEAVAAALAGRPPLRGIIHSAGTLDDSLLSDLSPGRFRHVLQAKLHGSWNLHLLSNDSRLTDVIALDFFVLFSSIAALFGSPGQANHAAASAFMDGLARFRRGLGLPGLSIQWGPWSETGAAVGTASADRVTRSGMSPIRTAWGIQLLTNLVVKFNGVPTASPAEIAAMRVDWRRWFASFPEAAGQPLLADLAGEWLLADWTAGQPAQTGQPDFRRRLQAGLLPAVDRNGDAAVALYPALSDDERRDLLEAFLRQQLAQVLRMPPDQVEVNTPLGSLGFDSLMALEVKNNLEKHLGLILPVALVWNYPTVAEMAGFILDQLLQQVVGSLPVAESRTAHGAAGRPDADGQPPAELDELSEEEMVRRLAEKINAVNDQA